MPQIDKDGLAQSEAALQDWLNTVTVKELGITFNVGSKVTPAQVSEAATTVLRSYFDFVNSPKI